MVVNQMQSNLINSVSICFGLIRFLYQIRSTIIQYLESYYISMGVLLYSWLFGSPRPFSGSDGKKTMDMDMESQAYCHSCIAK